MDNPKRRLEINISKLCESQMTHKLQSFFSYRVWNVLLYPWRSFGMLCVILAAARGTMGVNAGIMVGIIAPSLVEYQTQFQTFIGAILLIGAYIDLTIAVSMRYFLMKERQKAVTRVTQVIDRVLAYTIRKLLVFRNSYEVNALDTHLTDQVPG